MPRAILDRITAPSNVRNSIQLTP